MAQFDACFEFAFKHEKKLKAKTPEEWKKFYYTSLWIQAPFDKIMNGITGKYIFDMAMHHGLEQSTILVQRACCAAYKTKDYVKDDALFDRKTLSAINQASFMLIPSLIATRASYVRELVARDPKLAVCLDEWLERCFDISF